MEPPVEPPEIMRVEQHSKHGTHAQLENLAREAV